jgi:hypothetical protein
MVVGPIPWSIGSPEASDFMDDKLGVGIGIAAGYLLIRTPKTISMNKRATTTDSLDVQNAMVCPGRNMSNRPFLFLLERCDPAGEARWHFFPSGIVKRLI